MAKATMLPAICLLHIGMEVRRTTTMEMPYAVQDATGTVIEISFAGDDDQAHQHRRRGAVLESLPLRFSCTRFQ